jgi:alkylation response protein AidB-like acyl-CoA dehydrogenase
MNFGFSEEQDLLRSEVRRFLDERCPLAEVRRLSQTENGYCEKLWEELASMGWLGLIIPEAYGGAGLGWIDLVVVLEEMGRTLFPSPFMTNTLAADALVAFGSEAQKQRWLPDLANGTRIASLAVLEEGDVISADGTQLLGVKDGDGYLLTGKKLYVADPEAASLFIVSFRAGDASGDVMLALIDSTEAGVIAKSYPMIDATKRMGNLDLEGVRVGVEQLLSGGSAAVTRLLDAGAIAVTAESSGAVDAAIQLTAAYARERHQFGEPIGHYQGVKHPLAEMYVDLESFRSLLYYAAWCIESKPEELARYASLAKAYGTESFVRTGIDSIQLHGAIGFTTEYDIQLYFKRSKWARPMFGDADFHYERALALRGV